MEHMLKFHLLLVIRHVDRNSQHTWLLIIVGILSPPYGYLRFMSCLGIGLMLPLITIRWISRVFDDMPCINVAVSHSYSMSGLSTDQGVPT